MGHKPVTIMIGTRDLTNDRKSNTSSIITIQEQDKNTHAMCQSPNKLNQQQITVGMKTFELIPPAVTSSDVLSTH